MRVEYREFGRTGWKISAIGFGTWAIGSAWGPVDERASMAAARLRPHVADGYNRQNLTAFVEESLRALRIETIDLLQLHCPPTEVYDRPEVSGMLDDLVAQGKIRYYGVSG